MRALIKNKVLSAALITGNQAFPNIGDKVGHKNGSLALILTAAKMKAANKSEIYADAVVRRRSISAVSRVRAFFSSSFVAVSGAGSKIRVAN